MVDGYRLKFKVYWLRANFRYRFGFGTKFVFRYRFRYRSFV